MSVRSPLWPATLHHFRLNTMNPEPVIAFYRDGMGLAIRRLDDDLWLAEGAERRFLIGKGDNETVGFSAFALDDPHRLEQLQKRLSDAGVGFDASPSPLFGNAAFSVTDPDGQTIVFGVPPEEGVTDPDPLAGRLQHIVFATTDLDSIVDFYGDTLGFVESDRVLDDEGQLAAVFFRSDEEHHTYAAFRSDAARFDHVSFETSSWNDIRDWGDHLATMRIPMWWGPGRHGPGNNLFFMVRDPDGNRVELSAELELMPYEMAAREWLHEEHTLNLWGQAWMRS